jgi:hypothetical protein
MVTPQDVDIKKGKAISDPAFPFFISQRKPSGLH